MKRLVIVESPYSGDIETNVRYARACPPDPKGRGEAPLASHLLYTQEGVLDDTSPTERKMGMEAGFAWGPHADIVAVYTDLGISKGMEVGISRASENGKRIVFRTLEGWK